jgi:hypothetical protein
MKVPCDDWVSNLEPHLGYSTTCATVLLAMYVLFVMDMNN